MIQNLLLNEKVLENLYCLIFGKDQNENNNHNNNDLEQSTAKLTEYWKIEAENLENKFHRFNLFKKTLLHSILIFLENS